MNVYKINNIDELIKDNAYVGRGIIIGKTPDGKKAATAYFIMGRSENSRNRIFVADGNSLRTEPFDASKVEDPSLIIYSAVKCIGNALIVTNGDQTDTVEAYIRTGGTFRDALSTRQFEPDAPNLTPRISGIEYLNDNDFEYEMSILKSIDDQGSDCCRFNFTYPSVAGLGHFIHTYVCDGNPIPTFQGEPERVAVLDDIDEYTKLIWDSLNEQNKISLFVRYTDLTSGGFEQRIVNKNA